MKLKETGPHTGMFEATAATVELPAGALATDTAIDPNTKSGKTDTKLSNSSDFGTLDVNADGKVSQEELNANSKLAGRFSKADANADGSLSKAEFAKLQGRGSTK